MANLLHHSPPSSGGRRVFLATPSYGHVPGVYAICLFKTHTALQRAGFEVELGLLTGDCHVDDARNRLVRDFLKSKCDDLVFIDSDMGWVDADLIRLLSYDCDLVGGTYPLKQGVEDFPARLIPGEIWSNADGLIEVQGIPTGFMRVRRNVFERLAKDSLKYVIRGDAESPAPLIFEREINDGGRVSGDYVFCRKWRSTGGRVFLDPNCFLEHAGEKVWSGTYASFLRRKNGLALKHGIELIRKGKEDAVALTELILEWGNDPWSAGIELVSASAQVARQVSGSALETGSGLTSLVMAAANPDLTVHCLEHQKFWHARAQEAADQLKLENLVIHHAPLTQHSGGRWYQVPELPWNEMSLVLCDGPSRQDGQRKILYDVLDAHQCEPKCVLVDDADSEFGYISRWGETHHYRVETKGQLRPFALGVRDGSHGSNHVSRE